MNPSLHPPRLAEKILKRALPFAQRQDILGDMEEIFRSRADRSGRWAASLWYWRQAFTLPLRLLGESAGEMAALAGQEVRFALRTLRREPVFSLVTILILGLALGANTAIYSVIDGVLLERLPFSQPERLVSVGHVRVAENMRWLPSSTGMQEVYAEGVRSFEAVALYRRGSANLSGGGRAQRILSATVTPSLFRVLEVQPVLGRSFSQEEGRPWGPSVALISFGVWRDLYGGDPEVLGREIRLDGVPRQIVGVMGRDFSFPGDGVRVWVPLHIDPAASDFGGFNYQSIARLREEATPETAAQEMSGLFPVLSERFPYLSPEYLEATQLRPDVHPYLDDLVGNFRAALWILMATVGVVLLIACANVANLFLARAEGRQREMAVRMAIGAGRGQLAIRFITESGTLVAAGGLLGLILAHFGLGALKGMGMVAIPRVEGVGIDGSVLAVTGGIMALATLGFGVIPRLGSMRRGRSSTEGIAAVLRDGTGGSVGRLSGPAARKVLVTSQVALALTLLMASALLAESFKALRAVDPGFNPRSVLTFRVDLPEADYPSWEGAANFHREFLDRIQGIPGVEVAGAVTNLPLSGRSGLNPLSVDGRRYDPNTIPPTIESRAVTPEYFAALGIPVLAGRPLQRSDETGGTGAVLVSQAVARTVFSEEDPLGARVAHARPGSNEGWSTVVGVVGDVHSASLSQAPMGILYFAMKPGDGVYKGWLAQSMSYAVKTDLPAASILPVIRETLADLDPTLPLAVPLPLEEIVDRSQAEMVVTMSLVGIAAVMGLLLASVGLFGVVSYLTLQRTREIGIRVALGAKAASVRKLVVRQGMGITLAGLGIGILASLFLARFLEALLFGVEARDPILLGLVTLLLAAVSLVATWIPAARATRVNPVEALRDS